MVLGGARFLMGDTIFGRVAKPQPFTDALADVGSNPAIDGIEFLLQGENLYCKVVVRLAERCSAPDACRVEFMSQGTVLNLRTTTLHKCAAVPRRARI